VALSSQMPSVNPLPLVLRLKCQVMSVSLNWFRVVAVSVGVASLPVSPFAP
jgi:hypothetical protein